ncbi:ParB/RepB/Spo0J family partition protein [Helicobacter sp. 11S03491-1]|uniref:ParB/RepB/Spo0J family partition protein n=1 Tax=Helicobacter sp. 11S03491-1 TaxID=1476196 RepID=UPI000BA5D975|nr:ParB/RepB/Spo0J family partition protein [Helicobacter sp. 11S03491-1]PAF41860.1 chromosome partitioning protein ParB [Helicobacter sp. 11S03491-1]
MAKKNLALGRGLGAILSEVGQAYENNLSDNSELVVELDIDSIKPNPYQPRKHFLHDSVHELSESILEHGLLQPILVYEDQNNDYILIAGERRLRASKLANLKTIKAIVANIDITKLREIALIENIQREDLNPIDLANSYRELIDDYKITHDELAKKIKKSRTQITNTMRLLNLPGEIQKLLLEEKITQGHAKMLLSLNNEEQKIALGSIIGQKLSVRDTEMLVKKIKTSDNIHKTSLKSQDKIISDQKIIKLKTLLKQYSILSFIKNNSLVLEFSDKSKIDEIIRKLSSE